MSRRGGAYKLTNQKSERSSDFAICLDEAELS